MSRSPRFESHHSQRPVVIFTPVELSLEPAFNALRPAWELEAMEPTVVVNLGAACKAADPLGLRPGARHLRCDPNLQARVWSLSDFDTNPPIIHVPHWGNYNKHHRLSDAALERVLRATPRALDQIYFG